MATQDSYVQAATDGSGKKIDNATQTRQPADPAWSSTQGDTVYRQRVVIASDENPQQQVEVRGEAGNAYMMVESRTMEEILGCLSEIRDLLKLALM